MARRVNVNSEPYNAYLSTNQVPQLHPEHDYYSLDGVQESCKRYFCGVCGECHPMNLCKSTHLTEWVAGTTFPDSLFHSSEAYIIDKFTQDRFKEERQKLVYARNAQPVIAVPRPHEMINCNPPK